MFEKIILILQKILTMYNLNQIKPQFIGNIRGYDVYIPDVYYNPLSYNKKGCPIWIKIDGNRNCVVYIQQQDNKLSDEVSDYISKNLPKLHAYYCCQLTTSLKTKLHIVSSNKYNLDCVCLDEDDNIMAYIIVDDGVVGDKIVRMIKNIMYKETKALKMLRNYLLREENVMEHRSEILWHSMKDKEIIEILHFIPSEEYTGFFCFQFE